MIPTMSAFVDVASVGEGSTRFEKSLGLLTQKFVTLLQEAEGGLLDLKVVRMKYRRRSKREIDLKCSPFLFPGCRSIEC